MATDSAPLQLAELRDRASRGEIDTVLAGFTDLYGRLLGKRFDAGVFAGQVAEHGTQAGRSGNAAWYTFRKAIRRGGGDREGGPLPR